MSESVLVQSIRLALASRPGVLVERMNTGAVLHCVGCGSPLPRAWKRACLLCPSTQRRLVHYGTPGGPDVRVVVQGRYYAVECKSETGRQAPDQLAYERGCVAAGGVYVLARAVSDVLTVLPLGSVAR